VKQKKQDLTLTKRLWIWLRKSVQILRAAISAGADILLTGDKDFIESGIFNPKIMTATEFVNEI
jgi:hypothetical protein